MATEQNKAVVNRIWQEIFNNGNLDLIVQLYDPGYLYMDLVVKSSKGWWGRYLERMAKANRELFGGGPPRCCH